VKVSSAHLVAPSVVVLGNASFHVELFAVPVSVVGVVFICDPLFKVLRISLWLSLREETVKHAH